MWNYGCRLRYKIACLLFISYFSPPLIAQQALPSYQKLIIPTHFHAKSGGLTEIEESEVENLVAVGKEKDRQLAQILKEVLELESTVTERTLDQIMDELFSLSLDMRRLDLIRGRPEDLTPDHAWVQVNATLSNARTLGALKRLAHRVATKWECEPMQLQMAAGPEYFKVEYGIALLEIYQQSCGVIPKGAFERMDSNQLLLLRGLVGREDKSIAFTALLAEFGDTCETKSHLDYLGLCRWKRGNIEVKEISIPNLKKRGFVYFPLENVVDFGNQDMLLKWLDILVPPQSDRIKILNSELRKNPSPRALLGFWKSGNKTQSQTILDVFLSSPRENSRVSDGGVTAEQKHFLVQITNKSIRFLPLPLNLGQYDDGQLLGISDVDSDGNIEIWMSAEWGECDGEDLVPGRDCAITRYYRFEQFGERFFPFVRGIAPQ